jgi:PAS domain S-box-containing protein
MNRLKIFNYGHKFLTYFPFILIGFILVSIAYYIDSSNTENNRLQLRATVLNEISHLRARLEGNIKSNVMLINGLVAAVSIEPNISQQRFLALSSPLINVNSQILVVAAAPDLIVKYINPIEGNESVIGLDYRNVPEQIVDVEKSRDTGNLIMTDVINLVQGGRGVIARFPIFIKSAQDESPEFWGIVSAVFDIDQYFKASGLFDRTDSLDLTIRNLKTNKIIFGTADIDKSDPVVTSITLPFGEWQLAAAPKSGWVDKYSIGIGYDWLVTNNDFIFRMKLFLICSLILTPLFFLTRMFESLRKQKRQLQAIMDNTASLVYIKDTQGHYKFINQEFESKLNIKNNEILNKSDYDIFPKEIADKRATDENEVINKGLRIRTLEELSLADGVHYYISVKFPLFDNNNNLYALCIVATDITEQKKQQDQLSKAQKMDALGKLTGGIAHDYNNMLGIISGYCELLKLELSGQPTLLAYVNNIYDSSIRGSKLTKKLLNFTREKEADFETVDINALINMRLDLLQATLTSRIQLSCDFCENLWLTRVNKNDLEDVIINIIINAMHAIEGSGNVTISTKNVSLNTADANALKIQQGGYVLLMFADNGCGISAEILEKIFDPFFTTKGENGTGLGLSLVYGFMQRNDGAIKVQSKLNEGSVFSLYFPRCMGAIDEKESAKSPVKIKQIVNKTILVVDDEPSLLSVTSEILTHHKYKVLTADNGEKALEILSCNDIDLLLSDVIMPKMDGFELAALVKEQYPNVKIQLVSGYTDNVNRLNNDESLSDNVMLKPINSKDLLYRLDLLLQDS